MSIDAKRIGLLPLTSRLDPTTLGYQTVHDPALRADMRDLSDSAKEFTEMYRLKMTTARFDPALVFEALEVYEDIHAKAMLIRSFADLAFAENTSAERESFVREVTAWYYRSIDLLKWFPQSFARYDYAQIRALVRQKQCTVPRRWFIQFSYRHKGHIGTAEQERRATFLQYRWDRLLDRWEMLLAGVVIRMRIEGTLRRYTIDEAKSLLKHRDKKIRQKVGHALGTSFKRIAPKVAKILNEILAITHELDRMHKYRFPDSELLHSWGLPRRAIQEMNKEILRVVPYLARYLRMKQHVLGVRRIYGRDLWATLQESIPVPYSEAQLRILRISGNFSAEMYSTVTRLFYQSRLLDLAPRAGKEIGWSTYHPGPQKPPFILGHYTGEEDDVETLIHECCGHAYEVDASGRLGVHGADRDHALGEFLSTFAELLNGDDRIQQSFAHQEELSALSRRLDSVIYNVYQYAAVSEFERLIHGQYRDQRRALTVGEFCGASKDAWRLVTGKTVGIDDLLLYWWVHKTHVALPLITLQYQIGMLTGLRVHARMHLEGRPRVARLVHRQAQWGKIMRPPAVLRSLGVELHDRYPWRRCTRPFQQYVRQIERVHELREVHSMGVR